DDEIYKKVLKNIKKEDVVLDIGAGDLRLSLQIAMRVKMVYAIEVNPKRMIVTTVRVVKGLHPLVPVRSTEAIPKNKIFKVLDKLCKIELDAPVEIHQVVLSNAAGTGVDIIASRSLPAMME
ncbi:unnamed protein product, partial [marine sediment metagenome]